MNLLLRIKQLYIRWRNIKDKNNVRAREDLTAIYCGDYIRRSYITIDALRHSHRPATIRNYVTALNTFHRYFVNTNMDVNTTEMSASVVKQFAIWMKNNGIIPNTISCYIRSLRALYNYNDNDNVTPPPFQDISTANARTHKRALTVSEVNAIINLPLQKNTLHSVYRDVFIFSIYAFGMPFVDVYNLRWSDICDNNLTYIRQKTSQEIIVPLCDEAMDIIRKYAQSDSAYVFSILHKDELTNDYYKYQQQLARYNRALCVIARKADISKPLTSYVARHTWASIAMENGIEVAQISQAMGHTSIRTTQIYLKQLDNKMMRSICNNVLRQLTTNVNHISTKTDK